MLKCYGILNPNLKRPNFKVLWNVVRQNCQIYRGVLRVVFCCTRIEQFHTGLEFKIKFKVVMCNTYRIGLFLKRKIKGKIEHIVK